MNPGDFAAAIIVLGQQFGGSVTSWGRTVKHTVAVGGFDGDPHTWWLGADLVWDQTPDRAALDLAASALGVQVLHEATHDHVQPVGWQNQPRSAVT